MSGTYVELVITKQAPRANCAESKARDRPRDHVRDAGLRARDGDRSLSVMSSDSKSVTERGASAGRVLACSVRDCGLPLVREAGSYRCERAHTFDVARSGYVNLLQPQDRRAKQPGDSSEAVQARRALLDSGFGAALETALCAAIAELSIAPGSIALDAGSGDGHFLAAIAARFGLCALGIDISTFAIEAAAKRHRDVTWVVANADRRLPVRDAAVDLVVSIDGRRNPAEFERVLGSHGALVVAVPAEDDLAELRAAALGEAHVKDRAAVVAGEFEGRFQVVSRRVARARVPLGAEALAQLATATYRCARRGEDERLASIPSLDVTTSHHVIALRKLE